MKLFCFLALLFLAQAHASEPNHLAISVGPMTSLQTPTSLAGLLEYRFGYNLLPAQAQLNPVVGILGASHGSVYGFGGFRLDFPLSESWHWQNAVGVGGYSKGNGPNLDGIFEFCLAVSLLRQISANQRIGVQVFHISNAGTESKDPGANSFLAVFEQAF